MGGRRIVWSVVLLAAAASPHLASPVGAGEGAPVLPAAAADALAKAFPGAKVERVRREEEYGLRLLVARLRGDNAPTRVALCEDGTLIEVEAPVRREALPKPVSERVAQEAAGAEIQRASRVELRAELRLARLDKPRTTYDVLLITGDHRGTLRVAADGAVLEDLKWRRAPSQAAELPSGESALPKKAAEAIKGAFRDVRIEEVELEDEYGLRIYDAETMSSRGEMQVKVSEDGLLVATSVERPAAHLPKAVADAAAKAAPGADIGIGRKREVLVGATLVKLEAPKLRFEIVVAKGAKRGQLALGPDGSLLRPFSWGGTDGADKD